MVFSARSRNSAGTSSFGSTIVALPSFCGTLAHFAVGSRRGVLGSLPAPGAPAFGSSNPASRNMFLPSPQHRPLFPYFDQAKFGQNPKIIVADRRHFQPAGLDIPQRPAQPDGSLERKISEWIICHSRRLVRHFDQTLAGRRLLLANADNAVIAIRFHPGSVSNAG